MPLYRCELEANIATYVALERIRAVVGPTRATARPFIGTVEGEAFRMRRDIRYRNAFLPVVSGRVIAVPTGVRVRVTMLLRTVVAVTMLVWFSGVGAGVGIGVWRFLRTRQVPAQPGFLLLAAMLIVGAALVSLGFFSEAFKARRLLEQTLGARQAAR